MKTILPKEEPQESLPFSFEKKEIDSDKIEAHWQKIKEKIESDEQASQPDSGNDN